MAFLETGDGTKLFYRDWGEGAPVVLAASQAVSCDMWSGSVPYFTERGMRCITFDRRGHGRSEAPSGGYDIDTLADDLRALLARLDLRDVTLVGHSLGGAEVIRYLGRHGSHRVRRAVLLAATAPFMTKTADNPEGLEPAMFDAVRATWRRDFPGWVADAAPPFFACATSKAMNDWAVSLMLETQLDVLLRVSHASTASDLRADLRKIDVPTLVLHGDLDASVPVSFGRRTADLVRGSTFKRYADAAHGLFITHADRVFGDILEFIQKSS